MVAKSAGLVGRVVVLLPSDASPCVRGAVVGADGVHVWRAAQLRLAAIGPRRADRLPCAAACFFHVMQVGLSSSAAVAAAVAAAAAAPWVWSRQILA